MYGSVFLRVIKLSAFALKVIVFISDSPSICGLIDVCITINPSLPEQNGRHFTDDIFKYVSLIESYRIPIHISPNFIPMSTIYKKALLVQVMAWHRTGAKPLPEEMMAQFTDAYIQSIDVK